jgi:NAD(P)-dependent dehydrogenase (short-subunit alcohol dehydrogenase family)
MLSFSDMANKTALVTGSTQGIGQAVCRALLAQGVTVFGVGLDESAGNAAEHFFPIRCDLAHPESPERIVGEVRERAGSLDYLVNVAGRDSKFSLEEGTAEVFDEMVAVNLRAYYLLIRAAVPLLEAGRGKAIVNTSSIAYRLSVPKRGIYSTTKAGILGLTTGLARELGAKGIRINTVTPGWVFTERQSREYFEDAVEGPKFLAYLMERQSLGCRIMPEDVAQHILFYLSEASRASTGHNCVVDAGWILE